MLINLIEPPTNREEKQSLWGEVYTSLLRKYENYVPELVFMYIRKKAKEKVSELLYLNIII
jgi:hypothetical protein